MKLQLQPIEGFKALLPFPQGYKSFHKFFFFNLHLDIIK